MQKIIKNFSDSAKELHRVRTIVIVGLLIGINLIINNFSIQLLPSVRINFGFITLAITGMLFGAVPAMLSGAAADILGYLMLFSGLGGYFPGFTISGIISGMIFGLFLYKKEFILKRVILMKTTESVLIGMLLNTYWLKILMGKAFFALAGPRIIKSFLALPIEIILLLFVGATVKKAYAQIQKPENLENK